MSKRSFLAVAFSFVSAASTNARAEVDVTTRGPASTEIVRNPYGDELVVTYDLTSVREILKTSATMEPNLEMGERLARLRKGLAASALVKLSEFRKRTRRH